MTIALALPPASTLTVGDSSVTVTLCCSTAMAIAMSILFACPDESWMAGETKGAKPEKVACTM